MNPTFSIVATLVRLNTERIYGVTLSADTVNLLARRICGCWPDITGVVNEWIADNKLTLP